MVKKKSVMKENSSVAAVLKRLSKNKSAMLGLIIIIVLIISAIFAPILAPCGYEEIDVIHAFQGPSLQHWFGTDNLGHDIFSRCLYGGRYSLLIGVCTVALSLVGGLILGSVSGYFGGLVDNIIMRFLDIIQSIPGQLLAIAVSAVLGTGLDKCVIALAIASCSGYARILRASIMSIRKSEYLEAAISINCTNRRIIMRHILPNTISPLIVQATMGIASAILSAAGLSFIGLGVQPPTPEWGAMLSAGRSYIRDYSYMILSPGILIMLTVLSFNMLGDGLRDALDPKLKK